MSWGMLGEWPMKGGCWLKRQVEWGTQRWSLQEKPSLWTLIKGLSLFQESLQVPPRSQLQENRIRSENLHHHFRLNLQINPLRPLLQCNLLNHQKPKHLQSFHLLQIHLLKSSTQTSESGPKRLLTDYKGLAKPPITSTPPSNPKKRKCFSHLLKPPVISGTNFLQRFARTA